MLLVAMARAQRNALSALSLFRRGQAHREHDLQIGMKRARIRISFSRQNCQAGSKILKLEDVLMELPPIRRIRGY